MQQRCMPAFAGACGDSNKLIVIREAPVWRMPEAPVWRMRSNHERDWPASGDRFWPYSTTTIDSGEGLSQPAAADTWTTLHAEPAEW